VLIEDAEHPNGTRVRVEVIPGAAASAAASATTPPATEVRRVALGGVLEVNQLGATQSLERDAAFLALESAGIQNPSGGSEIVWSLRGHKPGETTVKLLSVGGLTPIATSRTIHVIIEPIPAK
jgi:hypothetical protein